LVDVRLRLLSSLPHALPHNTPVTVHTGAAEAEAHVSLLQANELAPGATAWAQLRFDQPLPVVRGDFIVVRSPNMTLGGGQIIDAHPRRHRRLQPQVIASLETLAKGTPAELLLQALAMRPPQELSVAAETCGLTGGAPAVAADLLASGQIVVLDDAGGAITGHSLVAAAPAWQELVERLSKTLAEYHRQSPLRRGMPQEELKSRLALPARVFAAVMQRLIAAKKVAMDGNSVRQPDFQPRFSAQQQAAVELFFADLAQAPYTPPARSEMEARLGEEVVAALIDQGKLIVVRSDVLFSAEVYRVMVDGVIAQIKARGRTNVAEVRDLFGTSRKYAIALLEHLDQTHVTRREGDDRVLEA
jgi:selenocysteine-specific elongation factor